MQCNQAGGKGVMMGIDGKLAALENCRMKRSRKRTAVPEEGTVELASSTSNSGNDDADDNDGDAGPSSAPLPLKRRRARASAVIPQIAAALDRTRTSDRNAVHILHAADETYNQIPQNLVVNRESIQQHRRRVRKLWRTRSERHSLQAYPS